MSNNMIGDFPYTTNTGRTYGQMIIEPSIEEQKAQAELERMNLEIQMRQVEMQTQMQKLAVDAAVASLPFEETEAFRDFIVWLCGFTDREEAPTKKEWVGLKDRVGKIAAKFALKARDDARKALRNKTATSGYAEVGAGDTQTLLGKSSVTMSSAGLAGNKEYNFGDLTS